MIRHFRNIKVLDRIDDNQFTGTIEWHSPHSQEVRKYACYGWSKGGSFFVYKIESGHIERLGTVKRMVLEEL